MPIPVKEKQTERMTAKEEVYLSLRDWITAGELTPGEKLNLKEIGDYFSVSLSPVREACQLLWNQKLVTVYSNKGTFVSELPQQKEEEWYLPLAHLHALAAEFACKRRNEKDLEELKKLDLLLKKSMEEEDIYGMMAHDEAFHHKILAIAANPFLTEFSETLMLHVRRAEHLRLKEAGESIAKFQAHADIIQAVQEKNREKAHDAMMENWLFSLQ